MTRKLPFWVLLLLLSPSSHGADLPSFCQKFSPKELNEAVSRLTPLHQNPAGQGINADILRRAKSSNYQIQWAKDAKAEMMGDKICAAVGNLQAISVPSPKLEENSCKLMVAGLLTVRSAHRKMHVALEEIRRCYDGSRMPDADRAPGQCVRGRNRAHLKQALEVGQKFSHNQLTGIDPRVELRGKLLKEHSEVFSASGPLAKGIKEIPPYLSEQEAVWERLKNQDAQLLQAVNDGGCRIFLPPNLRGSDRIGNQ